MSQIAGGSPPSSVTIDSMLALAEFVKNPQHVEYVRELRATEESHDKAAASAKKILDAVAAAQKKLDDEKAAHEKTVAAHDAIRRATVEDFRTKEQDLARREAAQ